MMRRINTAVIIVIPIVFLALVLGLVLVGRYESTLGSFTSSLQGRSDSQIHNIQLAAKKIDGTVLQPKEVFSFNRIVGERSADHGYVRAPAIVEGRMEEGLGGGICQVSSTLYNAVLLAGLKVVERHAHTTRTTSVPMGRDATVVFGGSDLRFKNTSTKPITVRASANNGRLVVRIVGDGQKPPEYRLVAEGCECYGSDITIHGQRMRLASVTVWREELRGEEVIGREFISSDKYGVKF